MKSVLTKMLIKIAVSFLVIIAIFYFLIMPKLSQLIVNQLALEKVSSDYRRADDKLADLNKIAKNKTSLDQAKSTVFAYLPDEPSPSTFIVGLEQMTSQIPIIIDSLSVTEAKAQATTSKTSTDSTSTSASTSATKNIKVAEKAYQFDASFKISYDKIATFLTKMESMSRFNTITKITIGSLDSNDSTLDFKATGKIYYGK